MARRYDSNPFDEEDVNPFAVRLDYMSLSSRGRDRDLVSHISFYLFFFFFVKKKTSTLAFESMRSGRFWIALDPTFEIGDGLQRVLGFLGFDLYSELEIQMYLPSLAFRAWNVDP